MGQWWLAVGAGVEQGRLAANVGCLIVFVLGTLQHSISASSIGQKSIIRGFMTLNAC
jgi:hypothetical protein